MRESADREIPDPRLLAVEGPDTQGTAWLDQREEPLGPVGRMERERLSEEVLGQWKTGFLLPSSGHSVRRDGGRRQDTVTAGRTRVLSSPRPEEGGQELGGGTRKHAPCALHSPTFLCECSCHPRVRERRRGKVLEPEQREKKNGKESKGKHQRAGVVSLVPRNLQGNPGAHSKRPPGTKAHQDKGRP